LKLASNVIPGFWVTTWTAALIGALVLALLQMFLSLIMDKD
jgi:uncharacterized membrane protein YvlD (DUF360 family)